jgi:hypothetical protein
VVVWGGVHDTICNSTVIQNGHVTKLQTTTNSLRIFGIATNRAGSSQ